MNNTKEIQKIFDILDEDYIAITWDGVEPLLILPNPKFSGGEEEMCQSEYIRGSQTDKVFEALWDLFDGAEPVRYNRN